MDWTEIASIALATLGGFTGAFLLVFKFCGKRFADYLSSRIQFHFDAKLEERKSQNEKKVYVSKYRFDKEYQILQEIVVNAFDFTFLTWETAQSLTTEEFDRCFDAYREACDAFTKYYYKNCAFLNEIITSVLDETVQKINRFRSLAPYCRETFLNYKRANALDSDGFKTHYSMNYREMMEIHDEINTGTTYGFPKIVSTVRSYLQGLEVK